jgi:hypothetical protein
VETSQFFVKQIVKLLSFLTLDLLHIFFLLPKNCMCSLQITEIIVEAATVRLQSPLTALELRDLGTGSSKLHA